MRSKYLFSIFSILFLFFVSPCSYASEVNNFQFEELTDKSIQDTANVLNSTRKAKYADLVYTAKDIKNADQHIEYNEPLLYKYTDGSFKEFIDNNSEERYCRMAVFLPDSPKSAYTVSVIEYPDRTYVHPDNYYTAYTSDGYEKNYIKNNIARTASKYVKGGKVYICEYDWIYIGIICDENDTPQYVVCHDSDYHFDKRSEQTETDNKEIKELLDTFDTLYNSYDWKVYDDNEHQYVFDFDFFVDVDKAIHGTLPDDYVFEPHGLESMAKNTIKTIDGRAYRFSKNGVCTGLYTGWSNTKNGKRFFRRGELVKGKTTINGKEYEFDKKGYLK